jgi:anti-anti-sigma factor
MLNATVQELGNITVLRCHGRIVIGDAYTILRDAVLSQTHTRMVVLDLAQVDRIDAGGLGVLLGLREWAHANAIRLRLMNVMRHVEQVLELTKLDRVFEFCSAADGRRSLEPWHRCCGTNPIALKKFCGLVDLSASRSTPE